MKDYTALERRLIGYWDRQSTIIEETGQKIAAIETRLLESEAENQTLKNRVKELESLV